MSKKQMGLTPATIADELLVSKIYQFRGQKVMLDSDHSIAPNQSEVHWEIDGKMPYPFNLMSVFYDMSKDFEKGLKTLKGILEK